MFSEKRIQLLAETLANTGIAFFVSAVLPIFSSSNQNIAIAMFGLAMAFAFWLASLLILK